MHQHLHNHEGEHEHDHDHDDHHHNHGHDHHDHHHPHELHARSRWPLFGFVLALLALVALAFSLVTVDQTEAVYITEFGRPVRLIDEPGLHFKWPYQSRRGFDKRLQFDAPPPREMLTKDKKNLEVAWEEVKANRGSGGVDGRTLEAFEGQLDQQLDRLHRELKEDTCQPLPVRQHPIQKRDKR